MQRVSDDIETFSPTVRMETIRHLFAKVVERNWDVIEVDIINAFATSQLPEPVYMEVPKMWQDDYPGKVCKVTGALYGLSYSPRTFHDKVDAWFLENGYERSTGDKCLYVKRRSAIQESDIGKEMKVQFGEVFIDGKKRAVNWKDFSQSDMHHWDLSRFMLGKQVPSRFWQKRPSAET